MPHATWAGLGRALGTQPVVPGQQFTTNITAQSQLSTVEEFEGIQVKADQGGGAVYLGDVARLEIGQEGYGSDSRFDGLPAAGFGVNLASGATAVDTAAAVRATLDGLASALPRGVELRYAYDTSPFAIVVVESVERVMDEEGLGPVEATETSMGQIGGAVIGIALVLSAVFLPMAFFGGSTGVIHRQFSVTVVSAMVLSALVALILTPALCASLLRPRAPGGGFLPARLFNRGFAAITRG